MKSREEMLTILRSIPIGAWPTIYTMDMGVQYEYATKDGCGECLGSMGDWPVHVVREISPLMLKKIQQLIAGRSLSFEEIKKTGLGRFYSYVFECERPGENSPDINNFFAGLCDLNGAEEDSVYILCDGREWEPVALFFGSYEELAKAFEKRYIREITDWTEFDDEELADWIEKKGEKMHGILINEYPYDEVIDV